MVKLYSQLKRVLRQVVRPSPPPYSTQCVSLEPDGESRGRVLIAYILQPFLQSPGSPVPTSHTHFMESVLIARAWLAEGFAVDVIDYRNPDFVPTVGYDYFVSARKHLKIVAERLGPACRKIAHFDTSHFAVNNRAAFQRLVELQLRRGVCLPASIRVIESNEAVEAMDIGVVLGNSVTAATYAYGGKPLHCLPVPAIESSTWNRDKQFDDCRGRFLWLGSRGLVHKGLDLVLEAFADMPDMHLTVCGPLDQEPEFCRLYHRELSLPNVHAWGWVDVASAEFRELAARSLALIYPSCGEGQAGAVVNCIQHGLIPIISRESGIDVDGFGEVLSECSATAIRDTIGRLNSEPDEELRRRSLAAMSHAESHHRYDAYTVRYRQILATIRANSKVDGSARVAPGPAQ